MSIHIVSKVLLKLVFNVYPRNILLCIFVLYFSELEESLLVMPFNYATDLLKVLDILVRQKRHVELVSKCLLFLMR